MAVFDQTDKVWRFLISPDDSTRYRVDFEDPLVRDDLSQGQASIAIERFSFTANNILYVVLGHQNRYWDLFPAEGKWGNSPAWGVGRVVDSKSDLLEKDSRLFGLFPLASQCVIQPRILGPRHVVDTAQHRQALAPAYNRYTRIDELDHFHGIGGDWQLLLRPLALVGLLAAHHFKDRNYFNAKIIYVTSASSKTGIGVGLMIKNQSPEMKVIGITSPEKTNYVSALDVYDQVIDYDNLAELQDAPSILFDLTGNHSLVQKIHSKLSAALKHSASAGRSHWSAGGETEVVGNVAPERFFTPVIMQHYLAIWGGELFERRFGATIQTLQNALSGQVEIKHVRGSEGLTSLYMQLLDGSASAKEGHIIIT
ncbi:DUF2855 family protein [Parasphingorhabdus sp.]|uniref:DUF2855 family protein n=1 Tax=Parasphingorhabdus sp. TaxID=2709688 RepID=UPI003D26C031